MDVGSNMNFSKIDGYIRWLEVALRAQVVCNLAFSKRYAEIEQYVLSSAEGLLGAHSPGDSFYERFERLGRMMQAVATKYRLEDIDLLRRHFGII